MDDIICIGIQDTSYSNACIGRERLTIQISPVVSSNIDQSVCNSFVKKKCYSLTIICFLLTVDKYNNKSDTHHENVISRSCVWQFAMTNRLQRARLSCYLVSSFNFQECSRCLQDDMF
jgi:hypothetical protein